jgi:hypothetical protein
MYRIRVEQENFFTTPLSQRNYFHKNFENTKIYHEISSKNLHKYLFNFSINVHINLHRLEHSKTGVFSSLYIFNLSKNMYYI